MVIFNSKLLKVNVGYQVELTHQLSPACSTQVVIPALWCLRAPGQKRVIRGLVPKGYLKMAGSAGW